MTTSTNEMNMENNMNLLIEEAKELLGLNNPEETEVRSKKFSRRAFKEYSKAREVRKYLNFTTEGDLAKVMSYLTDEFFKWGVGGSVAALLYGVNIERVPHDIDVIVSAEIYESIKKKIEDSPLLEVCCSTSSTDAEFRTQHIAFRAINTPVIDIIAFDDWNECYATFYGVNVMTPAHLLAAKMKYSRVKDEKDLQDLINLVKNLKS